MPLRLSALTTCAAGSERGHVLLVAIYIHDGVGSNGLWVFPREDVHTLRRVSGGSCEGVI
jgi:hypothetical protein